VTSGYPVIRPEANPNLFDLRFTRPRKRSSVHVGSSVYAASMRRECECLSPIEPIDNSIRRAYDSTVIHF
jgi:hypothetical protein